MIHIFRRGWNHQPDVISKGPQFVFSLDHLQYLSNGVANTASYPHVALKNFGCHRNGDLSSRQKSMGNVCVQFNKHILYMHVYIYTYNIHTIFTYNIYIQYIHTIYTYNVYIQCIHTIYIHTIYTYNIDMQYKLTYDVIQHDMIE